MAGTITAASQVLLGSKVRVVIAGAMTTSGASPIVTDDGTGLAVTLPPDLPVIVREDALPPTVDSVVRASVNGGPIETLVLALNNNLVLKWRRVAAGAFVTGADVLSAVVAIFVAPPPSVPNPSPAMIVRN